MARKTAKKATKQLSSEAGQNGQVRRSETTQAPAATPPVLAVMLKQESTRTAAPSRQGLSTATDVAEISEPAALVVRSATVSFVLFHPQARRVSISGEFNGWSPDRTLMEKHENGEWKAAVDLGPGRHQYKFVVDGEWMPDPRARENVLNEHGTLNSVIEVRC